MLTKLSHRTEKSIYSFDKSYYTHKQIYCVCSYVFYLGQENIRVYLLLCNTCDLPRVFSFHDLINISCLSYKCDYDVLYMEMHIYVYQTSKYVWIWCTYIVPIFIVNFVLLIWHIKSMLYDNKSNIYLPKFYNLFHIALSFSR